MLTSAFTQALQGETLFVTSENLKPFVEENFPGPLKVYGLKKPRGGLVGWFFAGMNFAGFMRLYASPRIDDLKIWDLHNVSKSVLFSWGLMLGLERSRIVARIQVRRTPKERLRRWMLLIFKKDIGSNAPKHVFERHLELIDDHHAQPKPRLVTGGRVSEFRPGQGPLRILVAPDAQHWKKIWPLENWKTLLEALSKLESVRVHVTLVGSRTWIDAAWIQERIRYLSVDNLQTRTELTDLARIASEHHLTLSSNSAWQHISEAVGTPVLSLAGPIVPEFGFSPWLKNSRELAVELGCRPCTLHGDGICYRLSEHHACMKQVTPRRVLQEMWRLLGYGSSPA
ncbi:MAG: glycosyltransferase family 9 protein [Bdellovibrionota bacterium]